jgi:hypothetical protein
MGQIIPNGVNYRNENEPRKAETPMSAAEYIFEVKDKLSIAEDLINEIITRITPATDVCNISGELDSKKESPNILLNTELGAILNRIYGLNNDLRTINSLITESLGGIKLK